MVSVNDIKKETNKITIEKYENLHSEIIKKSEVVEYYYSEPYYFYINFFLRNGRMPEVDETNKRIYVEKEIIFDMINQLDKLFEKLEPISEPIMLFKGVSVKKDDQLESEYQFQSTSPDINKALGFLWGESCCLLKVTLPQGSKALFTGNEFEEVILPRNYALTPISEKYNLETSSGDIGFYFCSTTVANIQNIQNIKKKEIKKNKVDQELDKAREDALLRLEQARENVTDEQKESILKTILDYYNENPDSTNMDLYTEFIMEMEDNNIEMEDVIDYIEEKTGIAVEIET